jgi:O-antigen ligase
MPVHRLKSVSASAWANAEYHQVVAFWSPAVASRPAGVRLAGRQWAVFAGGAVAAVAIGAAVGASPTLALACVLGVLVMAALIADFTWGVAMFIVLQFLIPAFGIAEGTLVKLLGAVLVTSWLLARLSESTTISFARSNPVVCGALSAFLIWGAISIAWAPSHGAALTALMRIGLNVLLLAMVVAGTRTGRDAKLLAIALAAGSVLSAVVALALGTAPSAAATDAGRLTGAGVDPNEFAVVLAQGIVLCIGLASGVVKRPAHRVVFAAGALVAGLALLATLSRGGLLALGAALITWIAFSGHWRGRAVLMTVALILAGAAWFTVVATPAAQERVASIAGQSGASADGGTGRTDIWRVGWRAAQAHPIRGSGLGNYTEVTPRYLLAAPGLVRRTDLIIVEPKVAHNMYLHLLVETGVIGLGLFLVALIGSVATAISAAPRFRRLGDAPLELLTRTMVAATVGVLTADFFLSGQYGRTLWINLGLCCALGALGRRMEGRAALPL